MLNIIMIFIFVSIPGFLAAGTTNSKLSSATTAQKNKQKNEKSSATIAATALATASPIPCPCLAFRSTMEREILETFATNNSGIVPDITRIITSYLAPLVWKQKAQLNGDERKKILEQNQINSAQFDWNTFRTPQGRSRRWSAQGTSDRVGRHEDNPIVKIHDVLNEQLVHEFHLPGNSTRNYRFEQAVNGNIFVLYMHDAPIEVSNGGSSMRTSHSHRLCYFDPRANKVYDCPSLEKPREDTSFCILPNGNIFCVMRDHYAQYIDYSDSCAVYLRDARGRPIQNGLAKQFDFVYLNTKKEPLSNLLPLPDNTVVLCLREYRREKSHAEYKTFYSIIIFDPQTASTEQLGHESQANVWDLLLFNNSRLIVLFSDNSLKVWDLASRTLLQELTHCAGRIVQLNGNEFSTLNEGVFTIFEQGPCDCVIQKSTADKSKATIVELEK